jgi:hypothetical protein
VWVPYCMSFLECCGRTPNNKQTWVSWLTSPRKQTAESGDLVQGSGWISGFDWQQSSPMGTMDSFANGEGGNTWNISLTCIWCVELCPLPPVHPSFNCSSPDTNGHLTSVSVHGNHLSEPSYTWPAPSDLRPVLSGTPGCQRCFQDTKLIYFKN